MAARGAVINSVFLVGLGGLNLLKTFVVAAFLTASQFGVWSIVLLALAFVGSLRSVAVGDKYVQQREIDQEEAFQKAFTLELGGAVILACLMLLVAPLLVVVYGQGSLLLPAAVGALVLPGLALQAPAWIFYRRMDFLRQRLLTAVDPVVGFVVTVALAATGFGYWSLVVGVVAGSWAGGLVAVAASPYRLALPFDRRTMREYLGFSWPLLSAVGAGLAIAQLSVFFGEQALGLAGAGAIGLAAAYASYTDRVDSVVTDALYPAVCRVRERSDLLLEAFTKSNRLALMWGVPFGVGLTLFAADLVHFGMGDRWADAIIVLQVFGVTAAINHIGFNWTAFYRAVGNTRPIAVVTGAALVAFLAAAIPLLYTHGLGGFAAGIAVVAVVSLIGRFYYLTKLFPGFQVAFHSARAIAPTIPAVAAVLLFRLAMSGPRTGATALGELGIYLVVTIVATIMLERSLLREALSYVRRPAEGEPQVA